MSTLLASMPRRATGSIESHDHLDGRTTSFYLRVRAYGKRHRVRLGTNHQGYNRERAQVELDGILKEIERGTWTPPRQPVPVRDPAGDEPFLNFASRWWSEKKPNLTERGVEDYDWRLQKLGAHPGLPITPVGAIDARTVDQVRVRLTSSGLSARSTNMVLGLFAQILDDAVDYEILAANPARGKRRRVKEPAKRRSFLEADMVLDLLDEAGRLEAAARPQDRYGRRAVLAMLCLAGPRIAEALDLPRSDLDLHGGRVRLGRKTQAGLREVELTAFLQGELRAHLAAAVALGRPAQPSTPLFSTRTGGRQTESQIRARLLKDAVATLNKRRGKEGKSSLPHVSPHALRRTFASLALAAGRDPRFVMAQLGHRDARFTLNIYGQVLQRQHVDRDLIWSLMRYPNEPDESRLGGSIERARDAQTSGPTAPEG